jgi:hypothetical protein
LDREHQSSELACHRAEQKEAGAVFIANSSTNDNPDRDLTEKASPVARYCPLHQDNGNDTFPQTPALKMSMPNEALQKVCSSS